MTPTARIEKDPGLRSTAQVADSSAAFVQIAAQVTGFAANPWPWPGLRPLAAGSSRSSKRLRRTSARRSSDRFDRFAVRKISTFCEPGRPFPGAAVSATGMANDAPQTIRKDSKVGMAGHPNPSSRPRPSVTPRPVQRRGPSPSKDSYFGVVGECDSRRAFLGLRVKTLPTVLIAIGEIFSSCQRGSRSPPSRA